MTQVELPQLSLQRYVDLVKRRRWHLLPVSLLGLVVGGLVAFLIPRYYVAETTIEHQAVSGLMEDLEEDPFAQIVDSAIDTIPLAVADAMEKLKWPEALLADPAERTLFVKDVASWVKPTDGNYKKQRSYALLRVTYRDQDGKRAAAFLNCLIQTWIKKRVDELREPAERARLLANEEQSRWEGAYNQLQADKQELERRYGVAPDFDLSVQAKVLSDRTDAQQALRKDLREREVKRDLLRVSVAKDRADLLLMPERVPPDLQALSLAAKAVPEVQQLNGLILVEKLFALGLRADSKFAASSQRRVAQAEAQLQQLLVGPLVDAEGLMPNLARVALLEKLAKDEAALAVLELETAKLDSDIKQEAVKLANLSEGFVQLDKKKRDLEAADTNKKAAVLDLKTQEATLAKLTSELPVRQLEQANVPPHPTDPNILIVALIGCLLGLGVAIGLILLLDMMQGSYKTIDDVERGLAVPVLGGMSHLETEEERVTGARGGRRAAIAAFAIVGLVVVVVTIFYVDPVRLPPVVRDLLAMLLG